MEPLYTVTSENCHSSSGYRRKIFVKEKVLNEGNISVGQRRYQNQTCGDTHFEEVTAYGHIQCTHHRWTQSGRSAPTKRSIERFGEPPKVVQHT